MAISRITIVVASPYRSEASAETSVQSTYRGRSKTKSGPPSTFRCRSSDSRTPSTYNHRIRSDYSVPRTYGRTVRTEFSAPYTYSGSRVRTEFSAPSRYERGTPTDFRTPSTYQRRSSNDSSAPSSFLNSVASDHPVPPKPAAITSNYVRTDLRAPPIKSRSVYTDLGVPSTRSVSLRTISGVRSTSSRSGRTDFGEPSRNSNRGIAADYSTPSISSRSSQSGCLDFNPTRVRATSRAPPMTSWYYPSPSDSPTSNRLPRLTETSDMSSRRLNRSGLVNYSSVSDSEYVMRMHEIVTAHPLGVHFNEPIQLLPHVWLGSQLHAESLRLLRRVGITHVLNCAGYTGPREFPERSPYEGLGIDYLEFKASDDDNYDMTQHFGEAFKYMDRVQQQGGKVLVHCAMGINRSVAVCIGYLMHHKQWPLLRCTEYVKERRKLCLSNEGFRVQLVQFARARGMLDKLPEKKQSDRYGYDDDPKAQRARELSRSLPRDPVISEVLRKGYFRKSDSLLDTGLMFRVQRFMNREKV